MTHWLDPIEPVIAHRVIPIGCIGSTLCTDHCADQSLCHGQAAQEAAERLSAREFSLHDQRHRLGTAHMYVHAVMGGDRLLYAMDYPYQFVPKEVVVQDNLPLDAGDKRKFFQTNAERLFSL